MTSIVDPFMLPCGLELPNRLAKAATTEGLADALNRPTQRLETLYRRWGAGGFGLLISGNVMVDRRYLERPGNVAVEGAQMNDATVALARWVAAGKAAGAKMIAQVSHAGRQTPAMVAKEPAAPSAVRVRLPGGLYAAPRAMAEAEIRDVVRRFAEASRALVASGFDGVQIHAAHGYLVSEFLNPLANLRNDDWGGSLENRARLLVEIVRATRAAVGPAACVAVKLNSSDFQKGGFSFEDCRAVVAMLNGEGVDFLEVSGGSYEQPKMMGIAGLEPAFEEAVRATTKAREAYFIDYAEAVRDVALMPVMATGGFRTRVAMDEAIAGGAVDLVGLARPAVADPEIAAKLVSGEADEAPAPERRLKLGPGLFGPNSPIDVLRAANGLATMAWFYRNIVRIADGGEPKDLNLIGAAVAHQRSERAAAQALSR